MIEQSLVKRIAFIYVKQIQLVVQCFGNKRRALELSCCHRHESKGLSFLRKGEC